MNLNNQITYVNPVNYLNKWRNPVHPCRMRPKIWLSDFGLSLVATLGLIINKAVNIDPAEHFRAFSGTGWEKFFKTIGGGFFHHHALGLNKVDEIAKVDGLYIQQIYDDPNIASIPMTIIKDRNIQEQVLEASRIAPIRLDEFPSELLDDFLPIASQGRFILRPKIDSISAAKKVAKKVRKYSKI